MQRYQKKSYINIFLRRLNHVLGWLEASKKFKNNYINTIRLDLSNNDRKEFVYYIGDNLSLFPEIKKLIREN